MNKLAVCKSHLDCIFAEPEKRYQGHVALSRRFCFLKTLIISEKCAATPRFFLDSNKNNFFMYLAGTILNDRISVSRPGRVGTGPAYVKIPSLQFPNQLGRFLFSSLVPYKAFRK